MSNGLYEKYRDRLPKALLEASQTAYANGLFNLCDPATYADILADGYNVPDAIIIGTTAFGDFVVWEKNKYVNLISFSKHSITVLESGFDFFFADIEDDQFLKKYFECDLYQDAAAKVGICKEDECYTISPIPFVGGRATIDQLKIGKIREYNAISIEIAGKLM